MAKSATINLLILSIALMVSTAALAQSKEDKANTEREEIRKMAQDVLARLYQIQPSAQTAIQEAAGYAVFSDFGMKILVMGSGSGKGVAVDNKSKTETFMKMVEIQAGFGFGVKKFDLVWVFETPEALGKFVNSGWEFGGQASAAAKAGEKGRSLQGALAVSPGVWLYQLTETGLAGELTVKGTKYSKNDDLN
jgi:lipid-binding SYLF domain-containing protein